MPTEGDRSSENLKPILGISSTPLLEEEENETRIYSYSPPPFFKDNEGCKDSGYESSSATGSSLRVVPSDPFDECEGIISTLKHKLHYSELHNADLMDELKLLQEENEALANRVEELLGRNEKDLLKETSFMMQSWVASPEASNLESPEANSPEVNLKIELAKANVEIMRLEEELKESAEERYSIVKVNEENERLIEELKDGMAGLHVQLMNTLVVKEQLENVLKDKEAALNDLSEHCEELKEIANQRRRPVNDLATPPGLMKYFYPPSPSSGSSGFSDDGPDLLQQDLGSEVIDLQLQEVKAALENAERDLEGCREELKLEVDCHKQTLEKLSSLEAEFKNSRLQYSVKVNDLKKRNADEELQVQALYSVVSTLEVSLKETVLKFCTLRLATKRDESQKKSQSTMTELLSADMMALEEIRTEPVQKDKIIDQLRSALACKPQQAQSLSFQVLEDDKGSLGESKKQSNVEEGFTSEEGNRSTRAESRCMELDREVDNLRKKLDQLKAETSQQERRGSFQFTPVAVAKRCECIRFNRRQQLFNTAKDETMGNKSLVNCSTRRLTLSPTAIKDTTPRVPLAFDNEQHCKKILISPRQVRDKRQSSAHHDATSSRLSELSRRNSMVLPHMKSCYPSEYIVLSELEVENVFKLPDPVPKVKTTQILRDIGRRPVSACNIAGEKSHKSLYPLR